MNTLTHFTPQQLRRAADIQEKIQSLNEELNHLLEAPAQTDSHSRPMRRRMSAAARAAIAAAARARWAKIKGKGLPAEPTQNPKRKMSAAARAKLSAAAKTRWKKAKAAGKTAL